MYKFTNVILTFKNVKKFKNGVNLFTKKICSNKIHYFLERTAT